MILANIYIDRLLHNRHFTVTSLNVRHLLLTALLVATKFIDDSFYSNRMFADAGMVSLDELNRMERIFLTSIGYSLFVNSSQFATYLNSFLVHVFCTNCSHCHQWMHSVACECDGCVGDGYNCGSAYNCIGNAYYYVGDGYNSMGDGYGDPSKSFLHFKSPVSTCAEPFDCSHPALAPFPMEWYLHCSVCWTHMIYGGGVHPL